MDRHTLKQVRGAKDLVQDAVEATVTAIAETHADIARVPYAALRWAGVCGSLVDGIEGFQATVTAGVYQAIRGANRLAGAAAGAALDRLEERESPPE